MKLDSIDRAKLLQSSITRAALNYPPDIHLWVVVRDLCAIGPTLAREICLELGWPPHMELGKFVQEQL